MTCIPLLYVFVYIHIHKWTHRPSGYNLKQYRSIIGLSRPAMFSFRTVLLLVLFALIAFVGSTNGILLSYMYYMNMLHVPYNMCEELNE